MPVVDSPLSDTPIDTPHPTELWSVLWMPVSRWTVMVDAKGDQMGAATEDEGLDLLAEAKKFIHHKSSPTNIAAVGLRLAYSPADEL